ncbi:SspB family protein [Microvirga mediterraneensis]|uniref:Stringent starvation protein B n=1 Tax=Microvirga mediterraneensis TaxID=2754695 RepID=A0A838BL32_9HYPH|nr:ClpXP protease specificity-enhancing factor SspB [Microvirga mediterraneensis]MBA1156374.1 Stringent starvation protein B [Microvirga mediterraneensis]
MAGGKDLIRYDLLVQDALKGVVRKVLIDCKDGLPGEHHFYISFQTDFPGVRLSNRLREKYPQEMTIVLQHQFWDLNVTEHTFEVGLSFSGIPERLLIPFDALTGFFDPSVQFGLKFDSQDEGEEDADEEAPPAPQPIRGNASEPVELKQPRKPQPVPERKSAPEKAPAAKAETEEPAEDDKADAAEGAAGSAEVVSLDAFRKKN